MSEEAWVDAVETPTAEELFTAYNSGEMTDEEFSKAVTESIQHTRDIGHLPATDEALDKSVHNALQGIEPAHQGWDTARVLIAAPLSWDYVPTPFFDSLMGLSKPKVWDWFRVRASASIATARNAIAQRFLETVFEMRAGSATLHVSFTHLFMVDADMVYPRDTLKRLLKLDKDIVSGFACMRDPTPNSDPNAPPMFRHTCGSSRGDNDFTYDYHKQFPVDDVSKWGVVSTGGVLIKRRVIASMAKPWFDNVTWTKTGDGKTRRVGEDVYFYSKAKALGFEIWCDTSLRYGHIMMSMTVPDIDKNTRAYDSVVTLP